MFDPSGRKCTVAILDNVFLSLQNFFFSERYDSNKCTAFPLISRTFVVLRLGFYDRQCRTPFKIQTNLWTSVQIN